MSEQQNQARKGTISVDTKDIFPIIKKWLYSEHDIFLRELVANATDAITKRATLARTKNQEIPEGKITVTIDKSKKTLTIEDNGLGMTEAEVEKYIAQLAFSGAEEFVKKMKEDGNDTNQDIIGKFGLGFYSVFMVADKVVVESLSMNEGATPTRWECAGDTDYTFSESDKKDVGTKITLYINEGNKENQEFLNEWKVNETLRNHCDFMPYPIGVLDVEKKPVKKEDGTEGEPITPTIVNNTKPLWKKDPSEVTEEEYKNFYRSLFPMEAEPLFWIHLKVDHPFTLEGILYFPKINPKKPFTDKNIRLYSKQVFVSDNVKNIIPEFLSLLKGTIDSSDIPLNVSRSSLQGDPNIKKISNYIVKKVGEALKKLYKNDREKYQNIWEDIGLFVKYGSVSDTKFDEMMRDMVIFKNSDGKYFTLSEYQDSIPADYKEKMKETILYFEKDKSDANLKREFLTAGIHTILTDEVIDPHYMQHVETHKLADKTIRFSSVDAEIENLLGTENVEPQDIKVKELFEKILIGPKTGPKETKENSEAENPFGDVNKEIQVAKIKNSQTPAYFKADEQMKRFSKMAESMGQNAMFPVKKTLVINPANPLIKNALKINELGTHGPLVDKICHYVEDLALISSEGLKPEDKENFVLRTGELVGELTDLAFN